MCKVCKPGYFLNYDGMCETLRIVNCSESGTAYSDFHLDHYDTAIVSEVYRDNFFTYLGLSTLGKMYGCQSCTANYKRV